MNGSSLSSTTPAVYTLLLLLSYTPLMMMPRSLLVVSVSVEHTLFKMESMQALYTAEPRPSPP